jgi:TonB family protein
MFDYAISHNQRKRPTQRFFVSVAASCVLHLLLVVILIENPWLLQGGVYRHFRGWMILSDPSEDTLDFDEENSRIVTFLQPMVAPSAETLKKLIYGETEPKEGKQGDETVAQLRWGDKEDTAPEENIVISTAKKTEPGPSPAGDSDASDLVDNKNAGLPESAAASDESAPGSPVKLPDPVPTPATSPPHPDPEKGEDIAANIAPAKIPNSIPKAEKTSTSSNVKIFSNEQQAISEGGPAIFDTGGFSEEELQQYASTIKQRVTNNWMITSRLRDSGGFTTIVFFIDRDGNNYDAHVVASSGNKSLDLTALNAILNSNPFPPLPQGFPGDHVGVKYVFIPEPQ